MLLQAGDREGEGGVSLAGHHVVLVEEEVPGLHRPILVLCTDRPHCPQNRRIYPDTTVVESLHSLINLLVHSNPRSLH